MSRTKTRFSAVFTALLVSAALAALALHPSAKGAKPTPSVSRPISYLTATSSFNIDVIDEKGTSSITVNRNASGSYARWSPDGLAIGGYYRRELPEAIMVMDPSGGNEQAVLTDGEFLAWNLARPNVVDSSGLEFFSSNCWLGTDAIIFTGTTTYLGDGGQTHTTNRLFVVDATGAITPLTESAPHAGYDRDPHWSAALDKVVFATSGLLTKELYAINSDGSELKRITDFGGSVNDLRWPTWSPAGDRVMVSVRLGPASNWQVWILDVDLDQPNPGAGEGGRVTFVDPSKVTSGGVQTAAWSPDGQRIVFSRSVYDSRNRKFFELVIADAVSGAETVIKRTSSNIELPDWNPVP
jgi:Tol biopolymer transport system component